MLRIHQELLETSTRLLVLSQPVSNPTGAFVSQTPLLSPGGEDAEMFTVSVVLGTRVDALGLAQGVVGLDGDGLLGVGAAGVEHGLDGLLPLELVHHQDALLGVVRPEHVPLEHGDPIGSRNIGRTSDNVEPILTVIVHGLNVVQEDVRPINSLSHQV